MIDALLSGKLFGKPQSRTSKSGNPFVTAKMRISGSDGAPVYANLVAFRDTVCAQLLELDDGSSIAVTGDLKANVYQAKDGTHRVGLDVTAHEILTPYHIQKRRKAMTAPTEASLHDGSASTPAGESK